jgi:hypothetical protein
MANYWNQEGVPHKGWSLDTVIDVREDGQEEWETDYESCMMCGNEKIRFVHIVSHPEINEEFRVGCICAEKMTGDYVNPKRREQDLQNRARRRANWSNKNWKISKNGNHYLKLDGKLLVIFRDKKNLKFKVTVDGTFGKHSFKTFELAKVAAFNGVEYLKEKGEW